MRGDGPFPSPMDDRLAIVFVRAHANVARRITALRVATDALAHGPPADTDWAAAEHEAHTLTGTAGTFGLARVSELARELEELLGRRPDDVPGRYRARHLVRQMAEELDLPPDRMPATDD